ncbi:MAG: Transcriptional regulator, TetR/AcrR family [Clostridia bacterium]|jgi:AcrR family transcriptional regulator|nr:Transcriptional regulator, TetR/AcrR family [Clostridia bacterium]
MTSKFLNLDDKKQKLILDAAIKEFGNEGYEKASTDTIANSAGISKGSLFNYFTNKLNLYLYVLEHVIVAINNEVLEEISKIDDQDFYDRLKKISLIKHKSFMKYPLENRIIQSFFISPPKSTDESLDKFKKYYEPDPQIIKDYLIKYLDESKLRDGITKEDALFITYTLFEGLIKRQTELNSITSGNKPLGADEAIVDFDKYIEVLKYGVYKE